MPPNQEQPAGKRLGLAPAIAPVTALPLSAEARERVELANVRSAIDDELADLARLGLRVGR